MNLWWYEVAVSAPPDPKTPGCNGMARRFNEARAHAGMTLREIVEKSGCPMSMLSEIANGARLPRVNSVEKVARALGVSAGWLAYGEGIAPDWARRSK